MDLDDNWGSKKLVIAGDDYANGNRKEGRKEGRKGGRKDRKKEGR